MSKLFLFFIITFSFATYAGQGRNGSWPTSIDLLRLSKKNLIDMVSNVSDADVQDAINNLYDQEEFLHPKDITTSVLKELIGKLQVADVLQIEEDTYAGVRLFYYENPGFMSGVKIYGTRNFYNNPRYQVPMGEFGIELVREVQTLVLHEVSHLWGFGEEEGFNYARTFAVRMLNILIGKTKYSYTHQEKRKLLQKLLDRSTINLARYNGEPLLEGEKSCFIYDNFSRTEAKLTLSNASFLEGGYLVSLIGSETLAICHKNQEALLRFEEIHLEVFYTKKSFLASFDFAKEEDFKDNLKSRFYEVSSTFAEFLQIISNNHQQNIFNINVKIKKEREKDYKKLISLRYTYSKPQDEKLIASFNELINSDMSLTQYSFWGLFYNLRDELRAEIEVMQNIQRREWLYGVYFDYDRRMLALMDSVRSEMNSLLSETAKCGFKEIGDYYKCYLDKNVLHAEKMIYFYQKIQQENNSLYKYIEGVIRRK